MINKYLHVMKHVVGLRLGRLRFVDVWRHFYSLQLVDAPRISWPRSENPYKTGCKVENVRDV